MTDNDPEAAERERIRQLANEVWPDEPTGVLAGSPEAAMDSDDDLDDDGYPTDATLARIREWDWHDLPGLFAFIASNWHWGARMAEEVSPGRWRFATGGWSGNEDLLKALAENLPAWSMTWQSSHRGGLHEFEVPEAFRKAGGG